LNPGGYLLDIYKQDGVNVAEGDNFSAYAGRICVESFGNSPFVEVLDMSAGYFRGVRGFRFKNLPPGYIFDMTSDGNGTKVIVSDAALRHSWAGYDLLAMSCGDITRNGGLPLIFNNVLDVSSLGDVHSDTGEAARELIRGLGHAAYQEKIVLFRGETAELGVCVGSDNISSAIHFNWSGSALGVYHPDKMITGEDVVVGDKIIALKENGFRANGISSVRKAFSMKYGLNWHVTPAAREYIIKAAEPSVLYDPFLTWVNGWYTPDCKPNIRFKKIIHVTGGAFEGKLGHDFLFKKGLSADLPDLFHPVGIMEICRNWRDMTDEDCYKTWNCGQGLLIVVSPEDVSDTIKMASEFDIPARVCGEVFKRDKPIIQLNSKFSGKTIVFSS